MTSLILGPFAIPMPQALLMLGFICALFAGWLAARKHGGNPEGTLFAMLLAGLLAARLGFAARYAEQYAAMPWSLLDIRDGGFLMLPGVLAAATVGAWLAWRRTGPRRPLVIALVSGLCVWGGASAVVAALDRSQQLPAVALTDLQGRPVDLQRLDGRPLVVNLWASWCPPCRREMPVLEAARQARTDVRFVLVNQGESAEAVASFLASQGLQPAEVLLDSGNRLGQATGSYGMPTTLFYAADGKLRHSHMGELSAASLERGLEQLQP
ncbi:TlpA disulfide reductase family protein [Pseudomonas citronellolis]|uniref:TlpA disulfide reductase family protein n=1 Tax=Pseudomonas citronellolis TaxID=53408 RepID=UPI0023E3A0B0|nr:TlpA disulfide reductase family protein [Pseudomonas citronellolis]MDF3931300.1 TlpA disulfide reductase family protein [Pseudomonas citronellolis]